MNAHILGITHPADVKIGGIASRCAIQETERWSPRIVQPFLWLDAADLQTISTSSGNSIREWRNKGIGPTATARGNFVQTTPANQPQLNLRGRNGLPTVDFPDGATQFLNSADAAADWKLLHDGTVYWAFFVVRFGNNANPGIVGVVFGNASSSAAAHSGVILIADDTFRSTHSPPNQQCNDRLVVVVYPASTIRAVDIGSQQNQTTATDNWLTANNYSLTSKRADFSNATASERVWLYRNGGSVLKPNTLTQPPSTANPTFNLQIGAISGGAPWKGGMAELIFTRDITQSQRQAIEGYLAWKWGIALEPGHPFSDRPPLAND